MCAWLVSTCMLQSYGAELQTACHSSFNSIPHPKHQANFCEPDVVQDHRQARHSLRLMYARL